MERPYEVVLVFTAVILAFVGVGAYTVDYDGACWWTVSGCALVAVVHARNFCAKTVSLPASVATIVIGAVMLLAGIVTYFTDGNFSWGWPIGGIVAMVVGAITATEHDEGRA
ncbi:MAG: hypothetical protein Q7R85_02990 [bacterium]|nr:hypothetical protein [bacterium]